jgi:hypothetical protein
MIMFDIAVSWTRVKHLRPSSSVVIEPIDSPPGQGLVAGFSPHAATAINASATQPWSVRIFPRVVGGYDIVLVSCHREREVAAALAQRQTAIT